MTLSTILSLCSIVIGHQTTASDLVNPKRMGYFWGRLGVTCSPLFVSKKRVRAERFLFQPLSVCPNVFLYGKGKNIVDRVGRKRLMSLPEITNQVILPCAVTEAPWVKSFFFQAGESPAKQSRALLRGQLKTMASFPLPLCTHRSEDSRKFNQMSSRS